jgi:hypothetical protein
MRFHIYLLTQNTYDEFDVLSGAVVAAESSTQARKLLNESLRTGDEKRLGSPTFWLDPRASKCRRIGEVSAGLAEKPAIILTDFRAG